MNPHRLRAYFYLLVVTIIWGAAEPIIKFTLGAIPALTFITYRFFLSAILAVLTFAFVGFHLPKPSKTLLPVLLYGFLTSTVTLGLLFFGLEKTTVLDTTLITTISPLIIVLSGVIFLQDRITKSEKLGMAVAVVGTSITLIQPLINAGTSSLRLSGNILIFAYLITNALSVVILKKLLRDGVSSLLLTNIAFIIGFVSLVPVLFSQTSPSEVISSLTHTPLIYHLGVFFMAIVSGNIAYTLSNMGQKSIEVSEAALFSYLYPLITTPLAVLWLGEDITPAFIAGAVLITIGVIIAEYKKAK